MKKHTKQQKLAFLLRIPKRRRSPWQNHEIKVLLWGAPNLEKKAKEVESPLQA